MSTTGWTGEPPDVEGPAMPVTAMLLSGGLGERQPGDAMAMSAARSRAAEARELRAERETAPDPDERAAALVARGYLPGQISQLSQRLAGTSAELEAERAKIARGERRQEIAMREHAAGRLDAMGVQRMLDRDQGDARRAEQLARRAEQLRRELREASEAMAPPQERQLDGVEAASRHAHRTFAEVTRAKMAAAEAGRTEPRPFASRGGSAARSEPVTCGQCIEAGATPEQSFLIHSDPDVPAYVQTAMAEYDQLSGPEAGRAKPAIHR